MSHERIESTVEEESTGKWVNPLAWTLLVAAGLVVLELTMKPGLAAPVMCAKFGWNDFRTALWLRRRDPLPERGRTCFWFYLASASWKVVITAILAMVGFHVVAEVTQNRLRNETLAPTFLTALTGIGVALGSSYVAFGLGWRHHVKVWLDSAVHFARATDSFPPSYSKRNSAHLLLVTAQLVSSIVLPFLIAVLFVRLDDAVGLGPAFVGLSSIACCIAIVIGIFAIGNPVQRRSIARTLWECWDAGDAGQEPERGSPSP